MRVLAFTCVAAVLLGGAVAGCGSSGSSNDIASKSPNQIVNASLAAIDSASSVHVAGSLYEQGSPITVNLQLASGKGGKGQMTASGLGFSLVAISNTVYLNGSPAFWSHFGGAAAATLLQGKWLKAPATGQFAAFAALTNQRELFKQTLTPKGPLTKGATTTVGGRKAVPVTDTSQHATVYVAATGTPYPLEIIRSGPSPGNVTLDDFNAPVSLGAPSGAIDISSLL
jgi:hypothetical protein